MSTYKELYEQAKKDKSLKPVTASYLRWEKDGQEVIGQFISKSPVTSSLGKGEYNQYLFKTDEGMVKFALGSSNDNEIGAIMKKGLLYRVIYKGKEDLQNGRRVNRFECEHIPADPDELEDLGDVSNPFLNESE